MLSVASPVSDMSTERKQIRPHRLQRRFSTRMGCGNTFGMDFSSFHAYQARSEFILRGVECSMDRSPGLRLGQSKLCLPHYHGV